MLAAQLLHRHAGFRLTQEADDLLFGKPLLHVQSPSDGGLDSKPRCYSKPGGRRCGTPLFRRHAVRVAVDGRPVCHSHRRSEEHTSELQSLMRISYAVFCLKKKTNKTIEQHNLIRIDKSP